MKHVKKIKSIVFTLIVVLMSTSLSFGQSAFSQKYGTQEDYKRLFYLNTQYIQSWIKSDTNTYNHLLWADDFVHQNSANGLLLPKKTIMPLFGQQRFEKIEYFYTENVTIQFITNDAAMIFARTPFMGVGQSTESLSQYNDVYVRRNGKWICVAANISMLTKPGDPPSTFTKVPEPLDLISYHPGTEKDKSILKDLNTKHAEAFMRSKVHLVESIFADDYVLLASNGQLYNKTEVLQQIVDGASQNMVDSYRIENLNIPEGVVLNFLPQKDYFDLCEVTISVSPITKPGTYNIIISGSGMRKTKGRILKLKVEEPSDTQIIVGG